MAKELQLLTLGTICAIVSFMFTGCQKSPLMESLLHAERHMDIESDSAQFILDGIKSLECASEKEVALYYLLKTELDDKRYVTHTTDSLIKISTEYYEKHSDTKRLIKAYYYMGRAYADMQDGLQAQEYFLKALELGDNNNDKIILFKIYNSLGTLYSYQDIYEMALPMYKNALDLVLQVKDSTNTSFILRNIGRNFKLIHEYDSTIFYFEKALDYSTPRSRSSILKDLACLYLDKNQNEKAFEYINEAKKSAITPTALYPIYFNLGRYFSNIQKYDSAQIYFNKSIECPNIYTKAGSYYYLLPIQKGQKKFDDYITYTEKYIQLQDSIEALSHFENIRTVQSMFNYQQVEKEKVKFEKKASQRTLEIFQLISFFAIVFIITFYFFKKDQRKKKLLLELQTEQYKISQQYIEDNKKQISKLEHDLSSGKEELSEVQKQLYEARKLMLEMENRQVIMKQGTLHILEEDFQSSSLYLKAHGENPQLNKSEWAELRELIDATYSNFTIRLRRVYPRISTEELHICYLSKMGLPVKKIAAIMNITSSGVSQCRRRLYKKLTNEPANAEKFDIFITNF